VIWRSLTHPQAGITNDSTRCELLSICDLTIFDTPCWQDISHCHQLWIAFNLWFDDLWHTQTSQHTHQARVVNCFQFVIWRSLTHLGSLSGVTDTRCELLSICDLTIFDTPSFKLQLDVFQLWIAFNLWFDDLWHTAMHHQCQCLPVVNCFQFVIWRSLTHLKKVNSHSLSGCELLSICDLTIFDTPFSPS